MAIQIWVNIGYSNGLLPVWCQPITWTNADPLSGWQTYFIDIWIKYQIYSLTEIYLKMVTAKCQFIQASVWSTKILTNIRPSLSYGETCSLLCLQMNEIRNMSSRKRSNISIKWYWLALRKFSKWCSDNWNTCYKWAGFDFQFWIDFLYYNSNIAISQLALLAEQIHPSQTGPRLRFHYNWW